MHVFALAETHDSLQTRHTGPETVVTYFFTSQRPCCKQFQIRPSYVVLDYVEVIGLKWLINRLSHSSYVWKRCHFNFTQEEQNKAWASRQLYIYYCKQNQSWSRNQTLHFLWKDIFFLKIWWYCGYCAFFLSFSNCFWTYSTCTVFMWKQCQGVTPFQHSIGKQLWLKLSVSLQHVIFWRTPCAEYFVLWKLVS